MTLQESLIAAIKSRQCSMSLEGRCNDLHALDMVAVPREWVDKLDSAAFGVGPTVFEECQHTETETVFCGGSEYMVSCKKCGKVLDT